MSFKIVLLLNICSSFLYSQSTNYRIREYSSHEGLSQSVVLCVLQDSKGFIWAGTQDGLNKFDGYNFKVYKHDQLDSNSISNNSIWNIFEDSQKNLWFCTYGGGLDYYNYEKDIFTHFQHSKVNSNSINGDDVRSIYEDAYGILWIGTKNGLNRFDIKKDKWEDFSKKNSALSNHNISGIYPYSEKELWLTSYGRGLIFFNIETGKSKLYSYSKNDTFSLSNNSAWEILKDSKGVYWIPTFGGGINFFNSSEYIPFGPIKFKVFHPTEIAKEVVRVFENTKGELFIGTDTDGFVIVDSTRNNLDFVRMDVNKQDGITNNAVWDFCEINSDNYYIGTFGGGLNSLKFEHSKIKHLSVDSHPVHLNNSFVFSIKKNNKGDYLIGTYGGGLNWINTKTGKSKYYTTKNSNITADFITDIEIENDSAYWISTDGNGISQFNPNKNVFTTINFAKNNKLQSDYVKCLLVDSYKNIWAGTSNGFCKIKSGIKNCSDSSLSLATYALLELEPGKILIGTHGEGVIIHDLSKNTFDKISNPLIENQQINELFLDEDRILWIGTRGNGLIKYNFEGNKAELFTEKNGLCNNTILGIEEDSKSCLWIITNNGLAKFDKGNNKFSNYFIVDGLLSSEFVVGAIYKDVSGIIYAGNIKGLEIIDPNKFKTNYFDAPFEITKLTILNEEHSLRELINSKLELSYKENFVKIDFSSLDFTKPEKNLYRYKLTPGNKDWVYLGTEHTVNFANLTPDEYLLELNGSNSDGLWSSNIKRLTIVISPPFYNTYWFYTLIIFTVGFIIFRFHHAQSQKRLEMERLRLKIASDLHDEVGSSLSQISINADMINYENDISKIKTKSEMIRSKSSEMINVMNDVIWSIDSRHDKLESLVERIKITAGQFASSKEIMLDFDITIQNPNKKLNVDFRQNLFLIVKEAINNAVKYSEGSLIKLKIHEQNEYIKITISDNGSGLPYTLKKTGSGIKNMKHRMEDIKGKIEFVNDNGLSINLEAKII